MQIDFAISLSYEEFQGNFGIWTVTRQKLCKDSKGNQYFTGSLRVNGKETNIQLRSGAVCENGKWVSNNIWKSNKYMELENEQ
ncbi:MAG: hypothetical protein MJZ93_07325 [Paludibacteraceae bacterium]|nr:hypothetical protein [Paludibacteraceae bacterium]